MRCPTTELNPLALFPSTDHHFGRLPTIWRVMVIALTGILGALGTPLPSSSSSSRDRAAKDRSSRSSIISSSPPLEMDWSGMSTNRGGGRQLNNNRRGERMDDANSSSTGDHQMLRQMCSTTVRRVRNQGACNSCFLIAAADAFADQVCLTQARRVLAKKSPSSSSSSTYHHTTFRLLLTPLLSCCLTEKACFKTPCGGGSAKAVIAMLLKDNRTLWWDMKGVGGRGDGKSATATTCGRSYPSREIVDLFPPYDEIAPPCRPSSKFQHSLSDMKLVESTSSDSFGGRGRSRAAFTSARRSTVDFVYVGGGTSSLQLCAGVSQNVSEIPTCPRSLVRFEGGGGGEGEDNHKAGIGGQQEEEEACPPKVLDWQQYKRKGLQLLHGEKQMMDALMDGPIVATFLLKTDFSRYNQKAMEFARVWQQSHGYTVADYVYQPEDKTAKSGITHHSVRLVGFGVQVYHDTSVKYWIAANSWGTEFGMDGFFKIIRGVNECNIEGEAFRIHLS